MHAPYRGHRIVPAASAPLDAFTTPAAAYSMRRLRSAYTGPAIRLRRASDNAEADIPFLGFTSFTGAPIDTAAANAHCNATTCFVRTWYDQSGLARDVVMTTAGLQPLFVANCQNGLPCARTTTAGQKVETSAGITTATGKGTLNAVAHRVAGGQYCFPIALAPGSTGNAIFINNNPNEWALTDYATFLVPAAAENAWHTAVGVINGASSVIRLDTAETAGTVAGKVTTGPISIASQPDAGVTCSYVEGIYWDNYFLTAGERAALTANQKSFWGF